MSKQPQKAYWNKDNIPHKYKRHSVKNEVLKFMGWNRLLEIIEEAENVKSSFEDQYFVSDWVAIDFAIASRINESVLAKAEYFIEHSDSFEVIGLPVIKRYEKVSQTIICKRCKTENEEFNVECSNCGANLVFAGKKKFQTRPKEMVRTPFYIPKAEATTKYLVRRLQYAREEKSPYLFFNPSTQKPITDSCFYTHFRSIGERLGIDLWCHRNRAERAKQLVEEYGFTRDDLKRFMMIVEEKTLEFYAGTSTPYSRKMGIETKVS
jgi:hypothetical protein